MYKLLGILVLALSVSQSPVEARHKVKITEVIPNFLNSQYINENTFKYSFEEIDNGTYTKVPFFLDVLKDFPRDTVLVTELFRSRRKNGKYKLYDTYVTHICDHNDTNYPHLPNFLLELTAGGKCVKKSQNQFDDGGHFKFWDIVDEKDLKGYHFKTYHQIKSYGSLILDLDFQLKSNDF